MSKVVKTYDYLDESGTLLFQAVRYEPKDFRQCRPDGKGGWIWNLEGVRRVLYRLPELLRVNPADWVFIVEGEKDVDRLYDEGLVATTCPMGAGKWDDNYSEFLNDRSKVVVIPDNDEPGRRHARQVAESLARVGVKARILELPGLPEKGDVSDWLDAGHDKTELLRLIDQSKPFVPANQISSDEQTEMKPVLVQLADVKPEKIEWLWENRVPIGKLSLLVGDPGLGKSFLTLYMAARITTGSPWPDDPLKQSILKGAVIILTAEDDIADTVLPRLKTNEADVSKVVAIQGVKCPDIEGQCYFNLIAHLPALEQAIIQTPESRLVIIDPITAYLGKTDSNKNAEVRGALAPLAALAGKYRVAVVGVSHLTKNQGIKAIYRTMGSLAFTAAARAVWVVSKDKDNPNRRLFTPCKSNLSIESTSLAFSIIDGMVCFEPEQLNISTDEALSTEPGEDKGALQEAEDFLREVLKEGAMLSRDVWKEAAENKIAERTLKRAKANLGIVSEKSPSGWMMELPETIPF
ncbi:MAG: AAA family ATPase [Candidatus Pacebacteria bacterium]|nr:AAA family ATPase [Candidatus Paceibacterota bacterium]